LSLPGLPGLGTEFAMITLTTQLLTLRSSKRQTPEISLHRE
jgi:hypothetical protein